MHKSRKTLWIVGAFFVSGCPSDGPPTGNGNDAVVTRTVIAAVIDDSDDATPRPVTEALRVGDIRLRPDRTVFTTEMELSVEAYVPPSSRSELQWYRNGERIHGAIGANLSAGTLRKGDEVYVEVVARGFDGTRSEPKRSRKVKVANMPPRITSRPPKGEIHGYRFAAEDIDGDTVTFSLEEAPAGASISSDGRVSWTGPFEPGKTYQLKVKASDGDEEGTVTQVIPIRIPGTPKPATTQTTPKK